MIPQNGRALLRHGPLHIERIVSSRRPDVTVYDQDQDEWVALLVGRALMEIDGSPVEMARGDTVFLPAHTPHRVLETSEGAVWLAIHLHPDAATRAMNEAP